MLSGTSGRLQRGKQRDEGQHKCFIRMFSRFSAEVPKTEGGCKEGMIAAQATYLFISGR